MMNSGMSHPETGFQRAAVLDRLYRRIGQLDDASLASLDALTTSAESIVYVDAPQTSPRRRTGRRAFLLTLLTGGIALVGGGTALLLNAERTTESAAPVPTVDGIAESSAPPTLQGEVPIAASPSGPASGALIDSLRQELTDVRAERIALRAQLDALRAERDQLTVDLEARQNDVAYLQQVVTIYEQMEAAGLDNAIATGLSPVGLALLTIQTGRDLLTAGIQQAAARLATVEVQAPGIANGLLWLENQVNNLASALQDLEDALSGLVEPVKPVAQQVGDFIGQVLELLPFGVGHNIRAGLEAIAALLTHIPELVASINPLVITPLRQWVSPDEDKGLVAEVVRPISANLITPAQGMVDQTTALETTFNEQLKAPVETALAARAALRDSLYALTGTVAAG